MLDIIVTHYNEPWEICRPFFDMLGCQRGISFSEFSVIVVHDGTEPFPEEKMDYPYRIRQYRIPHGGVSIARNYGQEKSDAEWVEFCDIDDCYTHIYALRMILPHMEKDVDYIWTPFFIEGGRKDLVVKTKEKENIIWVHGKYFRRKFLNENRIRFPEGIHYSEDSGFCAIVNELAQLGRRGKVKTDFPIYTWTFRKDSVSNDIRNEEKNLTGFIDRNTWVVEEYKRRGIDHIGMVGRMFADAYWAFHCKKNYHSQEVRFAKLAEKYMDDFRKNDPATMNEILYHARQAFRQEDFDGRESFIEWVNRLDEIREAG